MGVPVLLRRPGGLAGPGAARTNRCGSLLRADTRGLRGDCNAGVGAGPVRPEKERGCHISVTTSGNG